MHGKSLLTALSVLSFLVAHQAPETESDIHIRELIKNLPEYSWLRIQLQSGMRGEGKNKPYMERMRQGGVRRANFTLAALWHAGSPQNIRILERLYFSEYDGPHTQVRDEKALEAIARTVWKLCSAICQSEIAREGICLLAWKPESNILRASRCTAPLSSSMTRTSMERELLRGRHGATVHHLSLKPLKLVMRNKSARCLRPRNFHKRS